MCQNGITDFLLMTDILNELDELPEPDRNDTDAKLFQTAVSICIHIKVSNL